MKARTRQELLGMRSRDKRYTDEKAHVLISSGHPKLVAMGNRLLRCGELLKVGEIVGPAGQHGLWAEEWESCSSKECRAYQRRKRSAWKRRMRKSMPFVLGKYPGSRWYYSTVSLAAVPFDCIDRQMEILYRSFGRLADMDDWPYDAWFRFFGLKRTSKGRANCHLHFLGMILPAWGIVADPLGLFELTEMWREAADVDYAPHVDVTHPLQQIEGTEVRLEEFERIVAYVLKLKEPVDDPEWVREKALRLYRRHEIVVSRKGKVLEGLLSPIVLGRRRVGRYEFISDLRPWEAIYSWNGSEYLWDKRFNLGILEQKGRREKIEAGGGRRKD